MKTANLKSGGVKDVYVRDCRFTDTHSIASVKTVRGRGAYIRNVHYENCTLDNNNTEITDSKWFRGALYIDAFYGEDVFDADAPAPVDETTPVIEDIYFKNISLRTVAGNAIYICGLPERHFRNIYLENVTAHGKYGMKTKNVDNLITVNVSVTSDVD